MMDDLIKVTVTTEHNGVVWNSVSFIHEPSQKSYDQISFELSEELRKSARMLSAPFEPEVSDRWSTKFGNKNEPK